LKRNEGISLILLVITIIVIIIIAGAVMLNFINNNSIEQANIAVFKSNISEYNSELALALSNMYLQDNTFNPNTFNKSIWNGGDVTNTIKQYITSISLEDGKKFEIQKGILVYVGTVQKEKDWFEEMGLSNEGTTLPLQQGLGINTIAPVNSTVNGLVVAYNNPLIPKGFKAINDGAIWPTDWNKGLVIEDDRGNQFVWIPVDGTNVTYSKWCTKGFSYTPSIDDTLPTGIISEIDQVSKYGGFYISRYEAGKQDTNVLVSKKLATVWTNINYSNSKVAAESMYTTSEVKSGLVTGTQWDTTMKWLENSSINVSTNSSSWGNYKDSTSPANVTGNGALQVTGFSEYWKANNIYDLAGNATEWSNEMYIISVCFDRGGYYNNSGSTNTASYRVARTDNSANISLSFRVALYIL
jgi:hypothetical protein